MTDYRKIDSFDRTQIGAVGVSENTIAVASGQQITLVSGTDRSEFEHDAPVTDIALNERVVVLSSDRVSTYTRDGARVWSRTFGAPHAVTTLPDEPLVGVLEPDRLRAIDLETGQESFVVERRRPGQPRDDQFIGIENGFVSSTWSFLRCIDAGGEEVFDRNLNTAIRDVGCCDDVLVAALQNGQLKGIDATTGEQRWETELPVRQITPNGTGTLLLSTDDGIKSIAPDGSIDSAGSLSTGEIYASRDGSVVCSIRDGAVITHVPSEELIDIHIITESVGVGGTVDLEVTNLGETTHNVTLEAALDHADLAPSRRRLELQPREPTLTDFPVESVRTDGSAVFSVRIEGRTVAERPIGITDAAESTIAAQAELRPTEIENGVAELELSVENTGSIPLDSIRIFETSEQKEGLTPGETWTRTLTKPYEPGRTITVGMEVLRGNRRTELAPTCQLPDRPSIELQQKRDALHGRIEADEAVTWADELVIDAPGADRVRSPIRIDDGSMLVVLPIYEGGIARIGLSEIGITDQARMSDQGPLADLTTTNKESGRSGSSSDRSISSSESRSRPEPDSASEDPGSSLSASSSSLSSSSRTVTDRTEPESPKRDGRFQNEPSGRGERTETEAETETGGTLSIERDLSDEQTTIGHTLQERITVHSEGGVSDPTVVIGDRRLDPGEIAPGDTWTTQRTVGFFSDDDDATRLPEATVEQDGQTVDRVPAEQVTVTDAGLVVRGIVDPDDGRYEIELENGGDVAYRIDGIEIGGQNTGADTETLAPAERTTVTGTVQPSFGRGSGTVETTVAATTPDGNTDVIRTAAVVRELTEESGDDPFRKAIGSSTQVAGEYGTVVAVFENEADGRLADVSLEATGDPINDMLYSQARRETLPPGERIEHYVDLKTEAGSAEFEIAADYTDESGEEHSRSFRVAGPAIETEDEWTDEHRGSWTIEGGGGEADGAIELPSKVSTPFR